MDFCKKILDLHVEYINEMQAEGAWCGHAYAPQYFSDLRTRIMNVVNEIKEAYTGKRKDITNAASTILFYLETDYDALITKVYDNDIFKEEEKHQLADSLSRAFVVLCEDVFREFSYIYEKISEARYGIALADALGE